MKRLALTLLLAVVISAPAKMIVVKQTAPPHQTIYQAGAKMIVVKK